MMSAQDDDAGAGAPGTHMGNPAPEDDGLPPEAEERVRCHDVLMKYRKTTGVLAGRKFAKAVRRLKSERRRKEAPDAKSVRRLLHLEPMEAHKPVPLREIWKSGMSFLSREELKPQQNLLCVICFGAHAGVQRTVIYVQGSVTSCGDGKGIYPWKVEVSFTEMGQEAIEVLGDPMLYVPKG